MAPWGGRTVLFGGVDSSGSSLRDTWEWDGREWTQREDIGPDACAHSAMVFTGSSLVLFGGVDSIDTTVPPAEHIIFGGTWEWDGQRWTQVQDIGPKARWLHAMAYDPVAGKVVLFGGLSLFAPTLQGALLGDTWEHEVPRIVLVSLSLDPPVLTAAGDQSIATFTLSGPSTMGMQVFMGAFVDDGLTQPVSLQALDLPSSVIVDPGQTSGQFTIIRGNEALTPGSYTIATGFGQSVAKALLNITA